MFKRLFASRKHPFTPYLNQRDKVEIDLSGTKLGIELPPHTRYDGFGVEPPPTCVNIHDADAYEDNSHLPESQRSGLAYRTKVLGNRNWEFYGPPWRELPYGFIEFRSGLRWLADLPGELNCFNPAHFEQVLIREMYFSGPGNPHYTRMVAPVNWRRVQLGSADCIYLESHRDMRYVNRESSPHLEAEICCGLFIPLEERFFLRIGFNYTGYAPAKYSLANMNALRDSVLDSVTLQFGVSARQKLMNARKIWPDASASRCLAPLDWVYTDWREGDYLKGEHDDVIILKPGSPPPDFVF